MKNAQDEIAAMLAAGKARPFREEYKLYVAGNEDGSTTEGIVRIWVGEQDKHTASSGLGSIQALDGALKKAVLPFFSQIEGYCLDDFHIELLKPERTGEAGKAQQTRVEAIVKCTVEFSSGEDRWISVACDLSFVHAAWTAVLDAYVYGIMKEAN